MEIDTTEIVNTRFEYFYNPRTKDTILHKTVSKYKSGLFKIDTRGYIMINDHDQTEPYYGNKGKGYYSSHSISSNYFYWNKDNTIDSLRVIYKKRKDRDTLLVAQKKKNIFNKVKELQFENTTSYYKYSILGKLKSIKRVSEGSSYYTIYKKGLLIKQETSSTNKQSFEYDKLRRLIKAHIGRNDYLTYTYDSSNRILFKDRHRVLKSGPYIKRSHFIYKNNKLMRVNQYNFKDGVITLDSSKISRIIIHKYKNAL